MALFNQPPRPFSVGFLRARERVLQPTPPSSASYATKPKTTRKAAKNTNIDITKTKAYKAASRKWIANIVALPILFYTSWELYERTYGSKVQKKLVPARTEGTETKES